MKQQVRIIGGQFRGKKLSFPEIEGLRPTPDRIRETLFNWLMQDVRDARCLDAFAGSGALGIEAYSRGAKRVVLIEQTALVFNHLKKICDGFNSTKLTVIQANALDFLKNSNEQFDIVFLDPPFAANCWQSCLDSLAEGSCLGIGGLVYVESPILIKPDETLWLERKSKQAGNVFYSLFEKR